MRRHTALQALWEGRTGGRTGPHTPARPSDRHSGARAAQARPSAVRVPRSAAVAHRALSALPRGGVGTEDVDDQHRAVAEVLVSRRTTAGANSLSWVAQAVESVRTTSLPSAKRSGPLCAPTSGPTSSPHRANIEATSRSTCQPWSSTSRSVRRRGSAGRGRRDARRRRRPLRGGPVATARAVLAARGRAGGGAGEGPGQVEAVVAAGCGAVSGASPAVSAHGVPPLRRPRSAHRRASRGRRRRPLR